MTKYLVIFYLLFSKLAFASSETYHEDLKNLTQAIKDLTAAVEKNSKTLKKTALYIDDKTNKSNWPY